MEAGESCSSGLRTRRDERSSWRRKRPGGSRHDHIGTEHLLLGLLRETDAVAATALTSLRISLEAARERVAAAGPPQTASAPGAQSSGHIPFTPQAKRTLELALREALQLGHDYIGTGHILLGLVRDPGCRGASILSELGADEAAVREQVIELRPPSPASCSRPRGRGFPPKAPAGSSP